PCANYHNYGYSQQIFDASELQAGQITDIAFQYGSSSAMTKTNVKIYLGHTTKSEFTSGTDWVAADDLTEVYSGPFHCSGNGVFNTFTLTTPFNYNGTDNLVVAVHKENNGYEGSSYNFTYTYCSGSKTLYYQNDYTDCPVASPASGTTASFRNNVQFCFTPQACRSVTNLIVDNITTNRARAHWYPGADETEWHVINSTEQMTEDELAASTNYTTVTDNPFNMYFGLTKDMDYYFYVRGNCGEGETSKWKEIHYTTLPSCSTPATAVATSEADNSITFTVTSGKYGTEGTYDYRYWIVGTTDTTTISAQGAEYTATGIAGCVDYAWEARANCSGNGEGASRWVAGNDVHVCGAISLPYSESFETVPMTYSGPGMIETICWNDLNATEVGGSATYPKYNASTSYATAGSKTLQFYSSNTTPIYVILPKLADATQCQVKFDCAVENLSSSGRFQIGYLTDPTDATTFVPAFTDNPTATYSMQTRVANLFNIPEGARIAICYTAGNYTNYYGWIDNVRVDTVPYYNVATAVAPEVTPAIGAVEAAYNESDTLSAGVFYGGSAPVFTAVPNEGIEFINWTNANNGDTLATVNPWTINIAQDTAIVANFDTASFDLNVVVAPGHDIFGEVAGSGTFLYGRTVNFSATPMDHYSVVWPDGNTDNNRSMVMPGHDTTIVAHFTIDKHQLTVAMNDSSKGTVTGTGVYDYGTFVEITATPNDPDHIIFTGWSNGETNDTITIDLQHDSTVVANFIWDTHTVATSVNDESMGSVTGAGTYTHDDVARLIATPADHHIFVEWSNGLTNDTIDVTVVSDTALTATFDWDSHDITVLKNVDSMGVVTGAGNYYHGTPVTLTATPAAHHHFVDWSTGETTTTITVTADDDTTITANFAADIHTIAANVNDTVMGHVEGAGEYAYGTMATLTAVANEHYHFVNWSNGETSDVLSFVVVGDSTVTANFAIDQHIVTVNANDDALGTVTGAGTYNYGSQITLTATPADAHSLFTGWSNGETNDTIVITVTGDTTITANFTLDSHIITANVNDTVMGHVEGAGEYVHGSMATLTAVANEHYHFVNWSNGESSDVLSFVVVGDSTVTANFAIDQHIITAQINGNGSVTGEGTYNYGDQATLTATADAGYEFDGWEIDGVSYTDSTVTITVEKDMIVVANFIVKTSVEETEADNYVAYVENNEIIVSGVAEHTVSVYDMNGRLVSTIKNAVDVERFTVNAAGVYVIRVNNMASTRVIVK
ncbi:MAG: T9SS type A sorting domain-containing protein, partial [bacterium]|nr:T9SS type A sorting domain-containing protein [Candidatus Minthenecus merdequi]